MRAFSMCIALIGLALSTSVRAQDPFTPGERLTYGVYYYLMGVWVGAGNVDFSVHEAEFKETPCYKFRGEGKTHKRYDWFYKVNDVYESYANKSDLSPYRFSRNVSEGDFYFKEECLFDYGSDRVFSVLKVKEKPLKVDTSNLVDESFDVLSMIYHARTIDFENHLPGDKIPIKMFIDRETFDLFIRYRGVETYDHSEYGEIECYVFSPLLVSGTLFKEGERMTVYVSKDGNLIPVYVESEIRVGSIRAELIDYTGLLHPLGG